MESLTLPEELLSRDLHCQQHLLDLLNILQASEALPLAATSEDIKKVHLAQAKFTLRPLMSATVFFLEARVTLKKKELEVQPAHSSHSGAYAFDPFLC